MWSCAYAQIHIYSINYKKLFFLQIILLYFKFGECSTVEDDFDYLPFRPDEEHTIINNINITTNSIYGTGNKLKDLLYKNACTTICKEVNGGGKLSCCVGGIQDIKCMDEQFCQILIDLVNRFLIMIIFSTYFSLMLLTMIIIFIIFYTLSRKRAKNELSIKGSCLNGLVAALLVLFAGLIVPIAILKIISLYKKKSMTKLLGGNFQKISTTELVMTVNLKNEQKKKRYNIIPYNNMNNDENVMSSKSSKSGRSDLIFQDVNQNFSNNSDNFDIKPSSWEKLQIADKNRL